MVLAVLYSLSALLEIFLSCFPMPYLWDPAGNPGGFCINLGQAWLAVGLTNMIEDILIILLPLPVLWSLQLDRKRKFIISAIFSLGILSVCVTRFKTPSSLTGISIIVITAIRIKVIVDFDPLDASGHLGPITFWSIMEPLLGLINCCLPVIQPAISKLTGQRLWSISGSRPDQDGRYKWSRSLSSNGQRNGRFSRLDNMYPLNTVSVVSQDHRHGKQMGTSKRAVRVDQEDLEHGHNMVPKAPEAIMVEKRWEISTGSV